MRTIEYTYDEKHPTNKDYLIECLTGGIDDGGSSYDYSRMHQQSEADKEMKADADSD